MKTTKFLLLAALALCFALACSDDKELPTDESDHRQPELPQLPDTEYLIGTSWKLVAFVNDVDGIVKTPEPVSENNYWITFNKDGTFSAQSAVNELEGSYTINPATSTISITELGGTKINEQPDGDLFVQQLQSIQSFSVEQSSLKLYHTEKDYLLFTVHKEEPEIKPIDQSNEISITEEYEMRDLCNKWINLKRDEKVLIINSQVEMEPYINRATGYIPNIDFSKQTLLLISGGTTSGIHALNASLEEVAPNEYKIDITIDLDWTTFPPKWVVEIVMPKISPDANFSVSVTKLEH
jgi:heat shock protein HslJ